MYQSIPKPTTPQPREYPGHLTGVLLPTAGNLTQRKPAQSGIWPSCQNAGQRRAKQKDFVILSAFTGHYSYNSLFCWSLFCWSIWRPLKRPLNVGFLAWTLLLKWTNLRQTAFRDFRLCLVGYLHLNKRLDDGKIIEKSPVGGEFDAFWHASRWGIWPSNKLPTYRGIWTKFFKKVKCPGGFLGGGGDWAVLELTGNKTTKKSRARKWTSCKSSKAICSFSTTFSLFGKLIRSSA